MPQPDTTAENSRSARRSHQWWFEQVLAWQASGLSKTAYCAANDLKPANLYRWAGRFRQQERLPVGQKIAGTAHSPFVQAVVQKSASVSLASALTVEGITVQFKSGLEPAALAEWVQALRVLPC